MKNEMPEECKDCLTPVLIASLESANKELARLRMIIQSTRQELKECSEQKYSLQEQLVCLMQQKEEKPS